MMSSEWGVSKVLLISFSAKQSQVQGDGGRMQSKADSSSQPSLPVSRPLSNDFRNSPKPLNQQLEAKSTPALTGLHSAFLQLM